MPSPLRGYTIHRRYEIFNALSLGTSQNGLLMPTKPRPIPWPRASRSTFWLPTTPPARDCAGEPPTGEPTTGRLCTARHHAAQLSTVAATVGSICFNARPRALSVAPGLGPLTPQGHAATQVSAPWDRETGRPTCRRATGL